MPLCQSGSGRLRSWWCDLGRLYPWYATQLDQGLDAMVLEDGPADTFSRPSTWFVLGKPRSLHGTAQFWEQQARRLAGSRQLHPQHTMVLDQGPEGRFVRGGGEHWRPFRCKETWVFMPSWCQMSPNLCSQGPVTRVHDLASGYTVHGVPPCKLTPDCIPEYGQCAPDVFTV